MSVFSVWLCHDAIRFIVLISLICLSSAFRPFGDISFALPNLTVTCAGAMSSDIACSPGITGFNIGEFYPEDTLVRTCTADCGQALEQYANRVNAACSKQTWKGYDDTDMPLAIIPEMLRYHYNLTCLMDSGRYCNVVGAEAATASGTQGTQLAPAFRCKLKRILKLICKFTN